MEYKFDKIIIGAGLYGLYAAKFSSDRGEKVLVLEYDTEPFGRATYINQARVHMGYHYPRSLTTAMKSAGYFKRFVEDFAFCIHDKFEQVYATADQFSWTNAEQFKTFCEAAGIRCEETAVSKYFKPGMCDGAFITEEYTYDAKLLQKYFEDQLKDRTCVTIRYGARIEKIVKKADLFEIYMKDGSFFETPFILNASYASVNQVIDKLEGVTKEFFDIKYELCEIILCESANLLRDVGITVMDGPFFSIMPFGKTGLHSLTSVSFTPHATSYDICPSFMCQDGLSESEQINTEAKDGAMICTPDRLANCNLCPHKPASAWPYMSHLANQYLKEEYKYTYKQSLYSMKPILKSSEVDDSRPTAIKVLGGKPVFISVLSGKIDTVYDLDPYLE